MVYVTVTESMHCPKCGQTYAEGSQRFCDTDGSRLVSVGDDAYQRGRQAVFSSILPKTDMVSSRDELIDDNPRFIVPESAPKQTDDHLAAMFFDEDDETDFTGDGEAVFEIVDEPADNRVFGRKINPYEIPAGHVDIGEVGERDHPSINNLDFDADDPDAFVGRTVKGRYHITELIGEDDTGFAFLADDRIIDDKCVVVRILTNENLDEITESIFAEERVSLSHLNYPNIVRLIDSGQFVDGTTFLISEHLDALSIDDILHIHGPLNAMRTGRIIRQAGNGLSEVHQEGILHRDLRPAHLMIAHGDAETELVKLSHFGVSDGEPNVENLHYKAPEILDGRIPTIASDIYSLGVVAYQILTGRTPFSGDTQRELLKSERRGIQTHPTDFRPDLSPAVDDVFDKVLAADPLRRYPTAREFGDALYAALSVPVAVPMPHDELKVSTPLLPEIHIGEDAIVVPNQNTPKAETVVTAPATLAADTSDDIEWTRLSPEPLSEPNSKWIKTAAIAFAGLLIVAAAVWYYMLNRPAEPELAVPPDTSVSQIKTDPTLPPPDSKRDGEVPPSARSIPQPPNTEFFQNGRQNLKGDLYRNFVGYSLYYPSDWKVTGPLESTSATTRGKFLDLARNTPDGKLKEQMLISYYTSNGTFKEDATKFPELVKETNATLRKLIPNYQMVSEGNTTVNGGWNAYEVKFQGSGTSKNGERLLVWGRRLFIPASRPGVRAGFEITMLATSHADEVHSVDDVGIRGELASILYTFEPSQNF